MLPSRSSSSYAANNKHGPYHQGHLRCTSPAFPGCPHSTTQHSTALSASHTLRNAEYSTASNGPLDSPATAASFKAKSCRHWCNSSCTLLRGTCGAPALPSLAAHAAQRSTAQHNTERMSHTAQCSVQHNTASEGDMRWSGALAVHQSWAVLLILCLGHPHLLEGAQRRQDTATCTAQHATAHMQFDVDFLVACLCPNTNSRCQPACRSQCCHNAVNRKRPSAIAAGSQMKLGKSITAGFLLSTPQRM